MRKYKGERMKMKKYFTILVTQEMMESLEGSKPSGGWFNELCMNSKLFKSRKCRKDKKRYKAGILCPCFLEVPPLKK